MKKRLKSFIVCILIGSILSVTILEPAAYAQILSDVSPENVPSKSIETDDTFTTEPGESAAAETQSGEMTNNPADNTPDNLIPGTENSDQESADETEGYSAPVNANNVLTRHTITYYTDGDVYETVSVLYNTQASEPAAPSLPNGMNSFLGWYTEDGSRYFFNTLVTADIALHAVFSQQFLVQFMVNGLVVDSELADPGQLIKQTAYIPTAPEGDYFLYWYEAGQDEKQPYDFSSGVTKNVVLVPYFSASHYVFFYSEGTPVPEQLVTHGSKISTWQEPERAGYTFLGWSLAPDNEVFFDEESAITESLTLYAIWKPEMVEYTVVYWLEKANLKDDFDLHDSTHYAYAYTETRQALAGSIVRSEDFVSNEQTSALKHSVFSHGSTALVLGNGTTLLNVYYTRTIYTLQFILGESDSHEYYYRDPDGNLYHSGDYQYSITAKFEEDISDRWPYLMYDNSNNPNLYSTDETYKFTGWMIQEGQDTNSFTLSSRRQTLADDLIPQGYTEYHLNAVWKTDTRLYYLNYMVESLNDEEGENVEGIIFQRDMTLSQFAESSQTWNAKDISGLTPYYIETKPDAETGVIHVFLYYLRQRHTLQYDTQGGEFPSWYPGPWEYIYEQALEEPEDPFREGYNFTGWYQDSHFRELFEFEHAVMPARDLLLFAGWESSDHTVTFYDEVNGEKLSASGVETNAYISVPNHYELGKGYPDKGIFTGWYWYDASGRLVSFPFEIPVTKDIDVYAAWQTDGFELTYDGGEGSLGTVPTDFQTYALNQLALVQNADLTQNGQRFIGWQINGTGATYWPGNALEMYDHVNLQAKYTKPGVSYRMITFHGNGGTIDGSGSIDALFESGAADISISTAAGFTQPGYVLTGWSETKEAAVGEYTPDGTYPGPLVNDIILYAIWKPEGLPTLTITAHSAQKEYDGSPLYANGYEAMASDDGFDSIEGILILGSLTDAGTAINTVDLSNIKIMKNDQDITSSYHIIPVDGILEVLPRSAVIDVDSPEKYQGETDPVFTGEIKNLVSPDDLGDIFYHRADEHQNIEEAGSDIIITAHYSPNANYTVTVLDGKLTIKETIPTSETPQINQTSIPETGDHMSAYGWIPLIISLIIILTTLLQRKKPGKS